MLHVDQMSRSVPPEDERFTAVSSGDAHTCGLRADGSAVCWGQLRMPPEDERFTAISSGPQHACGMKR